MSTEFLQENPEVAKKVLDLIKETSNVTTMIEAKREDLKNIKTKAKTEYGIDGKTFNKLFKLYHNQARDQYEEEQNELLDMYDAITAPPKPQGVV